MHSPLFPFNDTIIVSAAVLVKVFANKEKKKPERNPNFGQQKDHQYRCLCEITDIFIDLSDIIERSNIF